MGTYSKIYIQLVFIVKRRQRLISREWDTELYKYITGIIKNKGQKLLAINGVEDHIHILICMKPTCCLSDLVREIKKASNIFIKENKYLTQQFEWQEGYGAFSYSHSALSNVINYVNNQKAHHGKIELKEEYRVFLATYDIEYQEKYVFD